MFNKAKSYLYTPCSKLNAYCWFWFQIKFIPSKTGEQITFTHSRITNQNNCKKQEQNNM